MRWWTCWACAAVRSLEKYQRDLSTPRSTRSRASPKARAEAGETVTVVEPTVGTNPTEPPPSKTPEARRQEAGETVTVVEPSVVIIPTEPPTSKTPEARRGLLRALALLGLLVLLGLILRVLTLRLVCRNYYVRHFLCFVRPHGGGFILPSKTSAPDTSAQTWGMSLQRLAATFDQRNPPCLNLPTPPRQLPQWLAAWA
jgi:hypothetical protein